MKREIYSFKHRFKTFLFKKKTNIRLFRIKSNQMEEG